MAGLAYIGSSFELPPLVEATVSDFVSERDAKAATNLRAHGYGDIDADNYGKLWTFANLCLTAVDLSDALSAANLDSNPLINEEAMTFSVEVADGLLSQNDIRHHVVTEVEVEGTRLLIDPTWSQALEIVGVTLDDVVANPSLLPAERIVCYKPEEADVLATWFASVARFAQNKVKTGVLTGKSDMFTRKVSALEIMLNHDFKLPAEYRPIVDLEAVGNRIWQPSFFRPMASSEIA